MANFRLTHAVRNAVLYSTTLAFTFANISPVYGFQNQQMAVNLNDINLAIKFEKLIEKAWKYYKANDSKKLIETMLDMKHETEGYTGQKIDINKSLDQVEREIKHKGSKISNAEIKAIRKIIKDNEKKHNHKAIYMTACMESGVEYNPEAVNFEFDYLCKAAKHDKDKDKEEEIVLPVRVTVGVVMALCGVFITVLPFPPCKTYGPQLIAAGVGLAIEGGCGKVEEDRKNERDKK
jgi:hypothetical protein